jgi:hypothetical protein
MIVQHEGSNSNPNYLRIRKSDIFNVTKAVARKSTLMQIIKAKAAMDTTRQTYRVATSMSTDCIR